ncbi:MAG TPA: hypothetical protein VMV92_09715 [Streptosporangiaceae bacterium]|nr:hypothetical protein [Streptosporangiaceae bacterium]
MRLVARLRPGHHQLHRLGDAVSGCTAPQNADPRCAFLLASARDGGLGRLELLLSLDVSGVISLNRFDVRIFGIRRRPGRSVFEVRWQVAGHDKTRSFITRALADSYRAELVRAARRGVEFDPATGEPPAWAAPEPADITWYLRRTLVSGPHSGN